MPSKKKAAIPILHIGSSNQDPRITLPSCDSASQSLDSEDPSATYNFKSCFLQDLSLLNKSQEDRVVLVEHIVRFFEYFSYSCLFPPPSPALITIKHHRSEIQSYQMWEWHRGSSIICGILLRKPSQSSRIKPRISRPMLSAHLLPKPFHSSSKTFETTRSSRACRT